MKDSTIKRILCFKNISNFAWRNNMEKRTKIQFVAETEVWTAVEKWAVSTLVAVKS